MTVCPKKAFELAIASFPKLKGGKDHYVQRASEFKHSQPGSGLHIYCVFLATWLAFEQTPEVKSGHQNLSGRTEISIVCVTVFIVSNIESRAGVSQPS